MGDALTAASNLHPLRIYHSLVGNFTDLELEPRVTSVRARSRYYTSIASHPSGEDTSCAANQYPNRIYCRQFHWCNQVRSLPDHHGALGKQDGMSDIAKVRH